jgi:hypothetical protein
MALLTVVVALLAVACIRGQASADMLMTTRNEAAQTVTVRWKSADLFGPNNLAIVDAGAETVNGVDAGTYTLSVDGGTATTSFTVARSTGEPKTSLLVVNPDLSLTLQ